MPQYITDTNPNNVSVVTAGDWYVKPSVDMNPAGWTLFQYGDEPDTRNVKLSEKNCVALCGNTKLIKQDEKDGYYGFRVSGGNLEVRATITKEIVRFQDNQAKKVWLSKRNVSVCLTQTKPKNLNKGALVTVEVDYGNIWSEQLLANENIISKQLFASIGFGNSNQILVTLQTTPAEKQIEPILEGTYKILAPDFSHEQYTTAYTSFKQYENMKNHGVWFPIKYINPLTGKEEGDRYIHPGQISHGCVTIRQMEKWNDLYDYFISHREIIGNGKYIGDIIVKEKK